MKPAPWDKSNLQSIEKGILKADLSINPANDGNLIRLQIPELTEERRKELVKTVKSKCEDSKVAIRNIRRDGNDAKKQKKRIRKFLKMNPKQNRIPFRSLLINILKASEACGKQRKRNNEHLMNKDLSALDMKNIPAHVAVIMDGYRRWAKKRGLDRERRA